ncbi:hypothetical protein GO013_14175 [Pseudodesulfovibrio sp. JC047]|uniref:hypothetical protein n=1 Tax=Pseudodesulfovibrio sp. JC047 TaxID=2683199 RepID=UPI0013D0864C|nr:hypothetical protein [Pseudodesulfovibrio sp. JC047]NDV20557.1 hypothetical protein [Pseudodesulfovibrio sp. JC047]
MHYAINILYLPEEINNANPYPVRRINIRLTILKMKKIIWLFFFALLIGCWLIWRSTYFAANFRTETFYTPIFTSDFNVLKKGTTIRGVLKKQFDVPHAFFLVIPCENPAITPFIHLDGQIRYSITSNGESTDSKVVPVQLQPGFGYSKGICKIPIFYMKVPNTFFGDTTTLEVTILSPITTLKKYDGTIRAIVAPAVWPK